MDPRQSNVGLALLVLLGSREQRSALPEGMRSLCRAVLALAVEPLRGSRSAGEWFEHLKATIGTYRGLRIALVSELVRSLSADEGLGERLANETSQFAGEVRFAPGLDDLAEGAARYALDAGVSLLRASAKVLPTSPTELAELGEVTRWLAAGPESSLTAARDPVIGLHEDLCALDSSLLTIADADGHVAGRAAEVAEAAAWEAYSRARAIVVCLGRLGLKDLPIEDRDVARRRARELVRRVGEGWTAQERAAFEASREPLRR